MTAAEAFKKSQEMAPRMIEEELKTKLWWINSEATSGKTNTSFEFLSLGCQNRLLSLGYIISLYNDIYTVSWEGARGV